MYIFWTEGQGRKFSRQIKGTALGKVGFQVIKKPSSSCYVVSTSANFASAHPRSLIK